jgi:GAF domain-containing protein
VNAKREQAINAMTAKITGTMDLETILSSALRELGKMPQVAEASVHIGPRLNSIDKGTLEFSVDK